MRSTNPSKDESVSLTKRILPRTLYVLSPISLLMVLVCLSFFNQFFTPYPQTQFHHYSNSIGITSPPPSSNSNSNVITSHPPPPSPPPPPPPSPPPPPPPPPPTEMAKAYHETPCDYSNGKWIRNKRGPLYNSTTYGEIKESQNCIANGRPDSEYLYWRWKPSQCRLPRFRPHTFLQHVKNMHIAFVGDSVAKNQFDSLICMLATATTPKHVSRHRYRWHFPSHNADLSYYWSPFLVEGMQRSSLKGPNYYNTIYLDHVNERWARDMDQMDLIVLSLGHWFSDVPSVYHEGGSVIGCQNCPRLNCTNIDFYGPLRKALRTALNSIIERRAAEGGRTDVIVRTYSPSHFEGGWDKGGTCKKTRPRRKGKTKLEGIDAEIRRIEIEEVENAKAKAKELGGFRIEVMDVTKLAMLRPDGHPGAYYKNLSTIANRVPKLVQNDCVHWCLPGPIDTWNEIFQDMMKKWVV